VYVRVSCDNSCEFFLTKYRLLLRVLLGTLLGAGAGSLFTYLLESSAVERDLQRTKDSLEKEIDRNNALNQRNELISDERVSLLFALSQSNSQVASLRSDLESLKVRETLLRSSIDNAWFFWPKKVVHDQPISDNGLRGLAEKNSK
jgi:hypothetical protein